MNRYRKTRFYFTVSEVQGARKFLQDLVLAYPVLCGSSLDDNSFFATGVAHRDGRGEYPPTIGLDNS